MAEHDGILELTEEEAAALFEQEEFTTVGQAVIAAFKRADAAVAKATDLERQANLQRVREQVLTQALGGRVAHIQAAALEAAALQETGQGEVENTAGELLWAQLAHKYRLYVPHGYRMEALAKDIVKEDGVRWCYCWDHTQQLMACHQAEMCPPAHQFHIDRDTTVLRERRESRLQPVQQRQRPPRGQVASGGR